MKRVRRSLLEPLDIRLLLSGAISGGVLTFNGTDAADDIRLDVDPVYINLLRITDNGVAQHFLLGDYTTIQINSLGGDDRIELGDLSAAGQPKSMIVDAGDGNDDLIGSPYADRLGGGTGNDTIRGGSGNDTLHGDDGNDVLKGDAGDDQINGDAGNDDLSDNAGTNLAKGGDGDDRITFSRSSAGISLGAEYGGNGVDRLTAGLNDGPSYNNPDAGKTAELYGNAGDDYLSGYHLHGGDGSDHFSTPSAYLGYGSIAIYGDGGNDEIHYERTGLGGRFDGGDGDDDIVVNSGNVYGGSGNDHIAFKDRPNGSALETNGTASGGKGNDDIRNLRVGIAVELDGNEGDDTLRGGTGNDSLYGDDGRDVLFGGAGYDELHGGAGNDSLTGGTETDVLYGDGGDDYLYGDPAPSKSDTKNSGDGLVSFGGLGSPPREGNDWAYGGAGRDWIDPDYDWGFLEKDPKDVKNGAHGTVTAPYGSGSYGSVTTNVGGTFPTGGTITPPTAVETWHTIYAKAAVFAGLSTAAPTDAQAASVTPPCVTRRRAQERQGCRVAPADELDSHTDRRHLERACLVSRDAIGQRVCPDATVSHPRELILLSTTDDRNGRDDTRRRQPAHAGAARQQVG